MGDPVGIGPEIAVKALAHRHVYEACRPVCIADAGVMERALRHTRVDGTIHRVGDVREAIAQPGTIDVFHLEGLNLGAMRLGAVSAAAGHAAFVSVTTAIELAMRGELDAVATGWRWCCCGTVGGTPARRWW
jgi:4-hydroxythreonine-4-phosphate dehydrogenase